MRKCTAPFQRLVGTESMAAHSPAGHRLEPSQLFSGAPSAHGAPTLHTDRNDRRSGALLPVDDARLAIAAVTPASPSLSTGNCGPSSGDEQERAQGKCCLWPAWVEPCCRCLVCEPTTPHTPGTFASRHNDVQRTAALWLDNRPPSC